MRLYVVLGRLFGMLDSMQVVTVRQVRVMGGSFMKALLVMAGGFAVMTRSEFVMLRCLLVMVRCFVSHRESSHRAGIICGTRGLCAPVATAQVRALRMEDEFSSRSLRHGKECGASAIEVLVIRPSLAGRFST
jgi:hypothetical protein